ncbi:hypothetical protein GCM10009839_18340 [Catenulispora yoronensis]|uniref:Uncharacterized protein n=1 Tax=Catenulispora yoronensis TaxID=450799 RepID=A0ABP5FAP4_9ACTN
MSERYFPAEPGPEAEPEHFATDCLPRLVIEPTMAGTGLFDGAWWPRSHDIETELPDLITAFAAHVGRIRRVAVDIAAWLDTPRLITVNGDVVRIGWLAASPGTISLSLGILDHRLLLVVPPETDASAAAAAMACAATTGNRTPAGELLGPVSSISPVSSVGPVSPVSSISSDR